MSPYRILVVDDDRTVCQSLKFLLSKRGFEVNVVHYPTDVAESLEAFKPHVILLDMNFTIETSGRQGLALLKRIREQQPEVLVILMTGWATVQLAVEGMKLGAKDFIAKPWDNKEMISAIESLITIYDPKISVSKLEEEDISMVGKHPDFLEVLEMAERVAPTEASVLILGESGTGKELLAEAIHKGSKRKDHVFVKVNLGGISGSLFESEMFGHKKGAFTGAVADREGRFQKAHKGTIFLDEIGDLEMDHQVKLLRVLQEKSFEVLGSSKPIRSDFRVISATNKDLQSMVFDRHFREDLFYRINLITLYLPSLNERPSDIPILVRHFMANMADLYEMDIPILEDGVLEWLSTQTYKGNIRELKNKVERTVLLNLDKKVITTKDFKDLKLRNTKSSVVNLPRVGEVKLDEMEEHMIRQALSFHEDNISKAARSLGITRSSLYRRLEKYNIEHESQS
ncbi:sigma-54-dependent transcriptional regulator [Portibacter marinus]|uniref:sigma-54-dependent transcriptional regulator n=1 Tax=Portibacter marinus TaxID=2898660 RepID=UPI001F4620FE|nr:sigma-54 dependent transcriptional regulator [Portibacter marinus]